MERVLTSRDRSEWTKTVESMSYKDVFDTVEYAALFEEHFRQEAVLFDFHEGNGRAVHIFFKRKINEIEGLRETDILREKDLYDLTSPWYFGGLLLSGRSDKELLQNFFRAFKDYCNRNNVVSEFIRFHPMFTEHMHLDGIMDLKKFNDVVYIDLRQDKDLILKNMKDTNREKIRKARRNEVSVTPAKEAGEIEEFHRLYTDSMERKNARDYYFFSCDFMKDVLRSFPDDSILLLARYRNRLIGGIIILGKYDYAYSYLSASDPEFLSLGANNILKYEAMLWAKQKGYRYFILGGGNAVGDSLFKFKASFSNTFMSFFVGRIIYDRRLYDLLSEEKIRHEEKRGEKIPFESDFFPRYRLGA